ncbi:MAG: hypothetical protein ACOCSF_01670 [Halanaeroarchaeum sp.]
MHLSATAHEAGGVTFVSLVVTNDADEPKRFRVASSLDGPVWPPRVHGVAAAGWDEAGYEGVLDAGVSAPLGFATPAPAADPPAEIAWVEPAGESEPEGTTPEAILRSMGDPRPPADVVRPDHENDRPEHGTGERP